MIWEPLGQSRTNPLDTTINNKGTKRIWPYNSGQKFPLLLFSPQLRPIVEMEIWSFTTLPQLSAHSWHISMYTKFAEGHIHVRRYNVCLVHLLSQNLVRAYSNFWSMLNFLCVLKIILVYSKIRFLYINWLIWVYQNCFEYTLKIWVYLKIWGHSKQILRKQMD